MKIRSKIMGAVFAAVLMAQSAIPVSALSFNDVIQLKGQDRYATASAIAGEMGVYDTVVLVNADKKLVDGLSASGLAGLLNAPILLVKRDSIPNETQLRIDIARNVYIIGSTDSVSSSLENKLKDPKLGGFNVTRIGGNDRFETSRNIASKILSIKGSVGKVFLTNGYRGEADAMSIAAVAARDGEPVILTNGKKIDAATLSLVESSKQRYAIGGLDNISTSLVSSLGATRVSGDDRYKTNLNVIRTFYQQTPSNYFLSDGYKLVDSLSGGPLAGKLNSPILFVSSRSDKSILKGAEGLYSLGGIQNSVIQQAVNAAK